MGAFLPIAWAWEKPLQRLLSSSIMNCETDLFWYYAPKSSPRTGLTTTVTLKQTSLLATDLTTKSSATQIYRELEVNLLVHRWIGLTGATTT